MLHGDDCASQAHRGEFIDGSRGVSQRHSSSSGHMPRLVISLPYKALTESSMP